MMMKQVVSALILSLAAGLANAAVLSSLVGDKDGFGISGLDAVPADGTVIYGQGQVAEVDDPIAHDQWFGASTFDHSLTYTHSYALGGEIPVLAELVIQTAGMSDDRGPWDVLFNGTLLGQILDNGSTTSLITTFSVAAGLLTGSDTLTLNYLTPGTGEGFSINFSELIITTGPGGTVPSPGPLSLLVLALALLGFTRRVRAS